MRFQEGLPLSTLVVSQVKRVEDVLLYIPKGRKAAKNGFHAKSAELCKFEDSVEAQKFPRYLQLGQASGNLVSSIGVCRY